MEKLAGEIVFPDVGTPLRTLGHGLYPSKNRSVSFETDA